VLVDDEFDADECSGAMQVYCRDVMMVENPYGRPGLAKRLLQLPSLGSARSFDRLRVAVPALQQSLDQAPPRHARVRGRSMTAAFCSVRRMLSNKY
jgi:polysaccharide biosynthesis protein PslH